MKKNEIAYPESSEYHLAETALKIEKEAQELGYKTRIEFKVWSNKRYAKVIIVS